jgi:ribosomal protein S18 acetylase RimI-like enzyme
MILEPMDQILAVCRFDAAATIPVWALQSSFFSISKIAGDLSITCAQADVPPGIKSEGDWRALKVKGPLDFALTGVLSSIAQPLAAAEISIFAISTFDTDYVLVKEENFERAIQILILSDHTMHFDFRAVVAEDIPQLREWMAEPHVAKFWQEPTNEVEFREKYLKKLSTRGVHPSIISLGGAPIGYIQEYEAEKVGGGWWPDAKPGTFGIDQYIGDPKWLNLGLGTQLIRQFVLRLFENEKVKEIITDPDPSNGRAIRVYEKIGFKKIAQIQTPGGDAYLLKLTREDICL